VDPQDRGKRTRIEVRPERFSRLQEVLDSRQPDLSVLMERVHKPHNFSAILRNCDAAGVLEAHAIPLKRSVGLHKRTSSSAAKWVQVIEHESTADAALALKTAGFSLVAADLGPTAVDYRSVDYTKPTAFVMGTEKFGLSDAGHEVADITVSVPTHGMIHSLNVSVATALLLFEAVRQREVAGLYDACRLPPEQRERLLFEWSFPRIARACRELGRPYPEMDDQGALLDAEIWSTLERANTDSGAS
jgi:tRNA (guanosine-2'-O-)-methyltransferase